MRTDTQRVSTWTGLTTMRIVTIVLAATLCGLGVAAQTRVFTTGTPEELARARDLAAAHLSGTAQTLGIDPRDLTITGVQVDQLSMAHVRVQQSFRGIPVIGAEAIVHLRSTGEVSGETNNLLRGVSVDTRPKLPMSDAIARALDDSHCSACAATGPTADLVILRLEGTDHLVYRVKLRDIARPSLPVVFVDAHDGRIVQAYDNLQTGKTTPVK